MDNPSFLARKTLGQSNYLLIAMAVAFVAALVPYGARQAIESSGNRAEDWLPDRYAESQDLAWFRDNFLGEQFVLVSWDGCTLGNAEKLDLLAKKLGNPRAAADRSDVPISTSRWYSRVITGPQAIEQLTHAPVNLTYDEAISRLEGSLVGPAQRDAHGGLLGPEARTTCLVANLSPIAMNDGRTMRTAVDRIIQLAESECDIDPARIHMGGPPVDNVAIDVESQRMLVRMAMVAGLAGIGLCMWRLRSVMLTAMVFAVGSAAAGLSLAIVFYFGAFEVLGLGLGQPRLGTVDAVLTALPAIAYVLGLSGAIHAINCYRHARREHGLAGAAERAVRLGWAPAALAAATMAMGLGALAANDILPIQRFGMFSAIAVLATLGALFGILPVLLHRFPLEEKLINPVRGRRSRLAASVRRIFEAAISRPAFTLAFIATGTAILGLGLWKLDASVQLLKLVDSDADLVRDYAWLEHRLGNLAPVEVVLTVPPERRRTANQVAEQDGQQYRMTMLERVELVREIHERINALPSVGGALSAATFAPQNSAKRGRSGDRSSDYVVNKNLEQNRKLLVGGDYLSLEQQPGGPERTGRELWRISARVAAMPAGDSTPDYAKSIQQLKDAVDPVLLAYQQRDCVVRALHEQGKKLAGAKVCVLFRAPEQASTPPAASQESLLARLLQRSGLAARGATYFNLAVYDRPHRRDAAADDAFRQAAVAALAKQDSVVLVSASSDPTVKKLADAGVIIANATNLPTVEESAAAMLADDGGPRPIRAVFTGMVPLVDRTQRELVGNMTTSAVWAVALILTALVLLLRNAAAGLATFVAAAIPIVATFGALGWLGVKIDVGVMMAACVALGVAVDGAIHYLTWYRRATATGLDRRSAARQAYDRCAEPMLQTTIIAGLGMAALATSSLTPMQHFGYLMLGTLGLALVGDLIILPAILVSPIGSLLQKAVPATEAKPVREFAAVGAPPPHFATPPVVAPSPTSAGVQPETIAVPPPRGRAANTADARHEVAQGPHSALQIRLQEIRRAAGGEAGREPT